VKFLIDAQLPKSLSDFLKIKGYDCIHTLELPEANDTTDNEILKYCEEENRVVITKDNDFLESFLITNKPKKLIFVRTGNIKNAELLDLFNVNFEYLYNSITENDLIEINRTDIIIHK
jgi:predicted nuclease of predicted toxin-antitoxin system